MMFRKTLLTVLILLVATTSLLAQPLSDQEYLNRLDYKNNRLDLVTKKRQVDEKSSYSHTDIDTITFSQEAYAQLYTDVDTTTSSRSDVREVTEWYIYKGSIRK